MEKGLAGGLLEPDPTNAGRWPVGAKAEWARITVVNHGEYGH